MDVRRSSGRARRAALARPDGDGPNDAAVTTIAAGDGPVASRDDAITQRGDGGGPGRPPVFGVLRYRDFRLIAVGNAVSQLGFWAQYVAVGWAASTLTTSKFLIALSFSAQFWPSLVLSPVAGMLADRYDRRRLVMFGNLAMVVPPVVIGLLIQHHAITLASLILLVMLGGAGQAFTQPATVAFLPALVPSSDLHSAIALNAGLTSSTRVVGPSLAGLIIAAWGVAWGFHINGVSFLAVAAACILVRVRPPARARGTNSLIGELRLGVRYARGNPVVARLILLVAVQSFFFMQAALMPIFARQVLHGGVSTYGLLSSAPGVGFVAGAVVTASLRTHRHRRMALIGGSSAIGVALLTVGISRSIPLTVVALGVFGLGFFSMNTTAITMLVAASADEYRGRVMGLFTMFTAGAIPINSVVAGVAASLLGAPLTVGLCGAAILVSVATFCASGALRTIRLGTG